MRERAEGSRRRRPAVLVAGTLVLTASLTGCGNKQSTLAPQSDQARQIDHLWWGMLAAASVVFGGAVAMLVLGWLRRNKRGWPLVGEREGFSTGLVVAFGVVVPIIALVALFAIANIGVLKVTSAPAKGATRLTIDVIGRQWFWDVRYPGTNAFTANEIHIPVRTPVRIVATTADVIHSFWVPELNRKIDTIPGKANTVEIYADRTGQYRGQCAEFCGLQHAHMGMMVYADTPSEYRAWIADMARPAYPPTTPDQKRGEQVFMSNQCSSCHTIAGTPAQGRIGPNLTHMATRATLAALTIPNRRSDLTHWIANPQDVKPGNRMPGLNLSDADVQAVASYLEGLR